ncbi:hypothetical protein GCM10010508_13370 [Streptomyces naganishii JCM 4654]|uniref:Uncharacterized protein n=1 Tax=Streptomyces naganishii JCM 4654 TaxID=1306179 RepID=A0A919CU79_9ACTN|nr:hypothetical protein GCM10010508_13370 [Streptomyces naganishii JCM 4654]
MPARAVAVTVAVVQAALGGTGCPLPAPARASERLLVRAEGAPGADLRIPWLVRPRPPRER